MENGRLSSGSAGYGRIGEGDSFLHRASAEESVGFRLGSLTEDNEEVCRHHNGDMEYDENRPLKSEER